MTAAGRTDFAYRDRRLGDTHPVTIATAPDVFAPTSTTVLLLRAARRVGASLPPPRAVLDLGCGCGIIGVVLTKLLPPATRVCASDLSAAAVRLARHNAACNDVALECRRGSLFEPWVGERFDLIVDDVAGVAEPIARLSGWYPAGVPSEAGDDGTRWIVEVLERAPAFLAPGGRLVFPVLTLSREALVMERARAVFPVCEQVEEQWYPLADVLLAHWEALDALAAAGSVRLVKRGSRWCWATRIFVAYRP
ncbi:MAG TPA: methyltransferase [Gemmatimonadales bacterium]|nr:methyltransferase [Gemmatimonadales bacterium]